MRLDHDLSASAQRHPDKVALICGAQRATYAQVERGANALAHALLALGLQRQERVAICLENSIEVVQGLYATLKAAGVFVVINPQVKGDKLAFILRDCQVRVLLTDAAHLRELRDELATCAQLAHIVVVNASKTEATARPVHAWSELLSAYAAVDGAPPAALALSIDLASLIYTSGSTGLPKGVMLTHANMHAAVRAITTYLRNAPDDIILSPLPLAFDYGLYQVLMAFYFGGTVVLEKQFLYPYQYIDRLVQERATGLPLVPAISAILLNLKDLEAHDFSSVRYVTNTAQAWPEHHIRRLRKIMPQARLYSMYGLTECKRVAYLPPELIDTKPTSVGVAIPGTEVWLESESGQVLSTPGEVGELMVRGPHVMPGYWNRPEETAQRLRPGRYPDERVLMTGDLFRQDDAGHLYFVSRKDDLIKTGGERVGPREVENVLYELEAVNEAAVIGVPDEVLGSAIKAFIALRAGMTLSAAEVIRHCRLRLEAFRVPKHVEFVPELPKTSTGKISKQSLR